MGILDFLKKKPLKKEKPAKKTSGKKALAIKNKKPAVAEKPKKPALSKAKKIIKKPAPKAVIKKSSRTALSKSPAKPALAAQKNKEKEIGVITHYYGKISVGIIKLKDKLAVGDVIHIRGAHDDFTQTIDSMQVFHEAVTFAGKGKEVGIKVKARVHENDKVFKSE